MNDNKNLVPIFYAVNDYYAPLLSVSLISMIKNADPQYHYQITVLYQELSQDNQAKLAALVKDNSDNFNINFESINQNFAKRFGGDKNTLRCDYFTLTIYYRLFIADMFPQYDKGIYLDADTVVTGDIAKLYNIDLHDKLVAGTSDTFIANDPVLTNYAENATGVKVSTYINSGVLLMNLKEFRDLHFTTHFLNLLNKYHAKTVAPDQDYLNAIANNRVLHLSQIWNAMPSEKIDNPAIIHYNLYHKPWHYDDVIYYDIFWQYAKYSNYYDDLVKIKQDYSDQQKAEDAAKMETLMKEVANIPEKDLTLKKIYDSGEKVRL